MRRRPDTELIARARTGSSAAAEVLFDRYWTHAWQAAYAVTANRSLVNGAAQEAMEKAFGASTASTRRDRSPPGSSASPSIAGTRATDSPSCPGSRSWRSSRSATCCAEGPLTSG